MLTDTDVAIYELEGFLLWPDLLGPGEVEALRAESDRLAELAIDVSLALGETSARLDLQRDQHRTVLRKVQPLGDISPPFAALATDPRLLGRLTALFLGAAPVLMEEKLNYKQQVTGVDQIAAGNDDESFPFHTDWHYFYLDGYPRQTLTVAVALDDNVRANGCMRVIPGSHHRDDWPLRGGWPPLLADDAVADGDAVDLVLPAGTAAVFTSALVHASAGNPTDTPRRLLLLSYHPAGCRVEPDKRNRHLRTAARAQEARYQALLENGSWTPRFRMATQ